MKSIFSYLRSKRFLLGLILALSSIATFIILIYPFAILKAWPYEFSIGDVSSTDIQAPNDITYVSQVLTEESRQSAIEQVEPIYLPVDSRIARQQVSKLRNAINFITGVRADEYATFEQKLSDISALSDARLSQQSIEQIISLTNDQWQSVQQEALIVLEQAMRNTIREDELNKAVESIPSLISFSLPEGEDIIVESLVEAFIKPNSLYSEELTAEAQQIILDELPSISVSFLRGETIVSKGQIINGEIHEALQQFELVQPENNNGIIISSFLITLFVAIMVIIIYEKFNTAANRDISSLSVIAFLFISFLIVIRIVLVIDPLYAYIIPVPAFGLLLSYLYRRNTALIFTPLLCVLAAYGFSAHLELFFFYLITSFTSILILGRGKRIASFFSAGFAAGLAGITVIAVIFIPDVTVEFSYKITIAGLAIANGLIAASFTLLFQYAIALIFGLTTPLRLLDISRPDHPLLQYILEKIPGTYQHCLQVANLAVQAAEAIDADALLVRVGSLYHDIGKSLNPEFFIENQVHGQINPHDQLDPQSSKDIIIKHVTDGIKLANKYHLPPRLKDFILEHHGTLLTNYQYAKALESAGGDPSAVNKDDFRYPGPAPRSKETALLMLADGIEARARAMLPKNEDELRSLIKKTIDFLHSENQLSNTDLTFKDLEIVTESFIKTLRNTHHIRIKYPEISKSDDKSHESTTQRADKQ